MKKRFSFTIVLMCLALMLSGCFLLNPIPEEYRDGIKVPREYPDDDLEIYDDATVFEVDEEKDEISITYGTEDDIDDVIDFYEDLFENGNLTIDEMKEDKDEFYAKGRGEDFTFEVEAEEADGGIEEELFKSVVEVTVEFTQPQAQQPTDTPAPEIQETATATPADPEGEYNPAWADNYYPYFVDVNDLTDDDFEYYIAEITWYYSGYYNGSSLEYGSDSTIIYYDDGSFMDMVGNDTVIGSWYVQDYVMYCTYENGNSASWEVALEFAGNTIYLYYYDSEYPGSFWIYATVPSGSIMFYTEDYEMTSLIEDRTFSCIYYMYADGSAESVPPTYITLHADGTFEEEFEGWMYAGTWEISDGYFEFGYYDSESLYSPIEVDYDTINDVYYIFFADQNNPGNYWVYASWG